MGNRTSNQCNVPPVDDPLGDVDESDVLAEVITGLQAQLNDLAVRYAQQGIEIERLRAALERCRLASGLAKAEIIDAALSGEPGNSAVETSEQCPGCVADWPRRAEAPWIHNSPQGERLCEDIKAIESASEKASGEPA